MRRSQAAPAQTMTEKSSLPADSHPPEDDRPSLAVAAPALADEDVSASDEPTADVSSNGVSVAPEAPYAAPIAAAIQEPGEASHWDAIDELAREADEPGRSEDVYARVLSQSDLPLDVLRAVGQRYVEFLEEWYEETDRTVAVLTTLVRRDAGNSWALEKLSLLLTLAERWDELLAIYDACLERATDTRQTIELLEEASRVAKDFAGQARRASDYLKQLFILRPHDEQLCSALERRLAEQERHQDLVDVWQARMPEVDEAGKLDLRVRITERYLSYLDAPEKALEGALGLLRLDRGEAQGCRLLEKLAAREETPVAIRRQALECLKDQYARREQSEQVIRVLGAAKLLAPDTPSEVALEHELVQWHLRNGDAAAAQQACANWLCLAPDDDAALAQLQALSKTTHDFAGLASALGQAATRAAPDRRMQLLVQAAETEHVDNHDPNAAIELYSQVMLSDHASAEQKLMSARALRVLLVDEEQRPRRLDALERLYQLEVEADAQRTILVEAAQLAELLEDDERALRLWEECLSQQPSDMVALDARVALLARRRRFVELLPALRARFEHSADPDKGRSDLIWIAQLHELQLDQLDQAVKIWLEIESHYGRTNDTADALANLYEQSARWDDLVDLLQEVEKDEPSVSRRTLQLTSLGDVFRLHQEEPTLAVACYGQALELSPVHEAAREGLLALLEKPSVQLEAAETLSRAYQAADEWQGTLELVEIRFTATSDLTQKQAVLLEAAELAEQRKGDATLALEHLARAFELIPSPTVEEQILRLAGSTNQWQTAVESYTRALEHCSDETRTVQLLLEKGRVLEVQLEDWGSALASYRSAVVLAPAELEATCAVVRSAGRLGTWDAAAWAVIEAALAVEAVPAEVITAFEQAATESWTDALTALDEAIKQRSLPAQISHDLKFQLGQWYNLKRGDRESAIRVLSEAVEQHRRADSLQVLVSLQEQAPSAALVASLLKLAEVVPQPLPHLNRAAHVALEAEHDPTLARPILERSVALAEQHLAASDATDVPDVGEVAMWSIEQLIAIAKERGQSEVAFELLLRGGKLPLDKEWVEEQQHRAAEIAADDLQRVERAIALCKQLLEQNPRRFATIDLLARLYEDQTDHQALLELRTDELARTSDPSRRLELRLEMSRVLSVIGDRQSEQLTILSDNLAELPGHTPTINALAAILTRSEKLEPLYELYVEQAKLLEREQRPADAAALFSRAGDLARASLEDVASALTAYRASVRLLPGVEALDALASIHTERQEHADAVSWLQHRLELTEAAQPAARQQTLVRLGNALRSAGKADVAIEYLSNGLQEEPSWTEVRELLSNLREERKEWLEFATLLGEGVAFARDIPTKVHYLKRAANVWWKELSELERAIPLLQRAYELVPDEQNLRLSLAEAQRLAGRLAPARSLLESLLSEFGRRRTAERANVHFQLSLIERAEGNLDAALEQLDAAARIQRTDPLILKTLGDVAQQNGELERAETAYRALLLLVGRRQAQAGEVGESAILFELYRIATQRNDEARAKDLLDSALQAADQNSGEAERLEEALKQAGQWELLLSALARRAERATSEAEQQAILRARTGALVQLGRAEDAFELSLQLFEARPADVRLMEQTEELASAANQMERFTETCLALANRLEESGERDGACRLWLRLGSDAEARGDLTKAAAYLERAQRTGQQPQATFSALRQVLESTGDMHGLMLALERYVSADATQVVPEDLTEALYRIAEHNLCGGEDRHRGLDQLRQALSREADFRRAASILETSSELNPPTAEMLQLLEEAARELDDRALLLKATLLGLEQASLSQLREAVVLSEEVGDGPNRELILRTVCTRAENEGDDATLLWALTALAASQQASGDFEAARDLLVKAAERSTGEEQFDLWLEVANLEHSVLGQAGRATSIFEQLSAEKPGDVRVWKPLLSLYRELNRPDALEACLSRAEESAEGQEERRALRLERIRLMLDAGRTEDAESALRRALADDSDNDEAASLLVSVLEQQGRTTELQALLQQLLDAAVARGAEEAIEAFALKLGGLLEASDPDAAVAVYRMAHVTMSSNRAILQALLRHVPDSDPVERADLIESLLPTEPTEGVVEMSLMLADLREASQDEPGVERAFELGFRRRPDSELLRDRLMTWYREREHWAPLAELLTVCALREPDLEPMTTLLLEAASIYDTQLGDAAMAADVLIKGLERDGMSLSLLEPACEFLVTAGRPDEAMELLSTALADERHTDESLALVYHLRAAVRARADEHNLDAIMDAIGDLETAGTIGGSDLIEDLATLLLRQQQLAELQGQVQAEREAVIRLGVLLPGLGQHAEAIEIFSAYCSRHPSDVEATTRWAELAFEASEWDVAVSAYSQLLPMLTGDAKIEAVLRLAEAADRSGQPLLAKPSLQEVYAVQPAHEEVSRRLRHMYEAAGAHAELANMLLTRAQDTQEDDVRFQLLRDAGEVLLSTNEPHPKTANVFEAALEISPQDHRATLGLARAHVLDSGIQAACEVLENAIRAHGKKRSSELSELQYGMSQVAEAAGDIEGRIAWLDAALQSDRRNGVVASELAILAMERSDFDTAIKALQLVTLLKEDGPMSRAEAYLRQAIISQQRGDLRKAVLLAKRALNADANYEPARAFLEQHAG